EAVLHGQTGSMPTKNSQGIDMLAGFAPIPEAGWGVVAQRPLSATMADLDKFVYKLLGNGVPFLLLLILAIWWVSRVIARPLNQLASGVRQRDAQLASHEISQVRAWYFEAEQLKGAIIAGLDLLRKRIGILNVESVTD